MDVTFPPDNVIASEIVRVYEDACARGRLVFKASQGAVIKPSDLPPPVRRIVGYNRKSRSTGESYVRFTAPKATYVWIQKTDAPHKGMVTVTCAVFSNLLDRASAVGTLASDMDGAPVVRKWDWGDYQPFWNVDQPTKGVRKQVYEDRSGWTMIKTETYKK